MRRLLVGAAALVLMLAIGVGAALIWMSPDSSGVSALPGLESPVHIRFDRHGVPWIRAENNDDAAEALGYLHARDRLAQMDLMRRASGGTLSALIGRAGLPLDRAMRVFGTERAAEAAYAQLPDRTRRELDAYARGVNAWIRARGRRAAPEYLVLGPPTPWRPTDSLLWAEAMGLALSSNLDLELARLALSDHLSREAILRLWPAAAPPGHVSRETSLRFASLAPVATETRDALPRFPAPFTLPPLASNAWAVAGRLSRTGAPLLAGDPHLSYGLPCLWYLARIDTPDTIEAGATAPGTPFVILGRNRRIAWSFTTADADTEDVFVERVIDHDHYLGPDGPLPFEQRVERIAVRDAPDESLTVRSTRHGPVISDLGSSRGVPSGTVLAAAIAGLLPGNRAAAGLDDLDHAGDLTAASLAATEITTPVQNMIVADRTHIGLFMTGWVPTRRSGDGRFPTPGWTGAGDWIGGRSGIDLPHEIDPDDGIVLNANEPLERAPALSGDPIAPFRARRIRTVLQQHGQQNDLDAMADLQRDVASDYVAALLPALRAAPALDARSRQALRLLSGWDGVMSASLPQPLIVDAWLSRLGDTLARRAGDPGRTAMAPLAFVSDQILSKSVDPALLASTLHETMEALSLTRGTDMSRWNWGAVHAAIFTNPLWARIPLLRSMTRVVLPVGGDASTVDVQAFAGSGPLRFDAVHGAAFRGDYDLSDLDRSRFVIATGESGWPWSQYLTDFATMWQRGGGTRLGAEPDVVSATLTLMPAIPPPHVSRQ